jgi:hypothetical protein
MGISLDGRFKTPVLLITCSMTVQFKKNTSLQWGIHFVRAATEQRTSKKIPSDKDIEVKSLMMRMMMRMMMMKMKMRMRMREGWLKRFYCTCIL